MSLSSPEHACALFDTSGVPYMESHSESPTCDVPHRQAPCDVPHRQAPIAICDSPLLRSAGRAPAMCRQAPCCDVPTNPLRCASLTGPLRSANRPPAIYRQAPCDLPAAPFFDLPASPFCDLPTRPLRYAGRPLAIFLTGRPLLRCADSPLL